MSSNLKEWVYHKEYIRKMLIEEDDVFALLDKEQQDKGIELWIKKDKKRRAYLQAKREWTLKPKKWTVEKLLFAFQKIIEKYGYIYHVEKMRKKYLKKAPEDMVEQAITLAQEKGILSNEKYVHYRFQQWHNKGLGKRAIIQKFFQDGFSIDNEIIDKYYDNQSQVNQTNLIKKLILKYKLPQLWWIQKSWDYEDKKTYYTNKQKCISALGRKGFSYSEIQNFLDNIEI